MDLALIFYVFCLFITEHVFNPYIRIWNQDVISALFAICLECIWSKKFHTFCNAEKQMFTNTVDINLRLISHQVLKIESLCRIYKE